MKDLKMNLRERCQAIAFLLVGDTFGVTDTSIIESFAREIRNEALEESANKFDEYYKIKGPDVAIMIRALKTAKESEK